MTGLLLLTIAAVAAAQTGAPATAFEVASVKLFEATGTGPGGGKRYFITYRNSPASQFQISGTRVTTNGNLMSLVAAAYGLERFQIRPSPGWPGPWATSERYDIEARAPGEAVSTLAQVRQMMQTLLAERFQLKTSRQTAVVPVYDLVVGPGGVKIKPSAFANEGPAMRNEDSNGNQFHTRFQNYSMADFVNRMMSQFDRPLLDKTGLTGGFDFSLEYTYQPAGLTSAAAAEMYLPDPQPGLPIASSIREQLGLLVVRAKEPLEILVIDRAERPSAN